MHADVSGVIIDKLNKGRFVKHFLKQLNEVKKYNFDIVFHCFNETAYTLICFFAKIPIRIGDSQKLIPSLFNNKKIKQDINNFWNHEVDLNLALLKGIEKNIPKYGAFNFSKLFLTEEFSFLRGQDYVVIHPGVGKGNRNLSPGIYKEFVKYLTEQNFKIVLTGSIHEKSLTEKICKDNQNCFDLAGKTNLILLVSIISNAKYFISVDTGPMHLASSLGIPVLMISTSKYVKPTRWGPYGVPNIIIRKADACGLKCFPYTCKKLICTNSILLNDLIKGFEILNNKVFISQHSVKNEWRKICLNVMVMNKLPAFLRDKVPFNIIEHNHRDNFLSALITNDISYLLVKKKTFFNLFISGLASLFLSNKIKVFSYKELINNDDIF